MTEVAGSPANSASNSIIDHYMMSRPDNAFLQQNPASHVTVFACESGASGAPFVILIVFFRSAHRFIAPGGKAIQYFCEGTPFKAL